MKRKIGVIAFRGNAILPREQRGLQSEQMKNARKAAQLMIHVVKKGYELIHSGKIVIAAGGGGIPVFINGRGLFQGVEEYSNLGHFPPGSVGPKIQAAVDFIRSGGEEVLITSASHLKATLINRSGTKIIAAC